MERMLLWTGLVVLLQLQLGSAYKIVCYFTNWSQYRPEPAKFFPRDVDPCLCTHLIYAFATMNDNKIAPYEWNDIDVLYTQFQTLKDWSMGIESTEMLQAFEEEAKERGKPRLLITAAVSAGKGTIDVGYEIAEIGKLLDFISVMTYDFHHVWDTSTRHNSPLCEYAMKPWRDNGVPSEKLIMGFLTYGRTFWLSTSDTSVCAQSLEQGHLVLTQICAFLSEVTNAWIEDQKVPYAYKNPEWVGYDNIKSYGYKVDFLKENNFGGAMIWAIDLDDFLGSFCNKGKYSLTIKLKSRLGLSSGASLLSSPHCSKDDVECTPPATKTWYNPPVTTGNEVSCANIGGDNPPVTPGSEGFCANVGGDSSSGGEGGGDGGSGGDEGFCTGKADGIFSNPKDTTKSHQCVGGKTFHSQCAQGLVFHQNRKCCNWPSI
ncbi:hypothetical protein J1605_008050 [Eschrichtius robustus]|uniref:chitinase n=1 Tax=Eschrichtius robustus TaxID=9764 RepID=A0AB34H1Y8_ESCRO|nr:hypothetical protein J1605_008050 [Eschrichtius robustus]